MEDLKYNSDNNLIRFKKLSEINETGLYKAAVLLIALGSELSSRVLKQGFYDEEIEKISSKISELERVTTHVKDKVINEFNELIQARDYLTQGGVKYAKQMLEKALGHQKANEIIKKLTSGAYDIPFQFLQKTDPKHLLTLLAGEHPQTIAVILSYLEPEKASQVLLGFPKEVRTDVARRIAIMERPLPEAVKDTEAIIKQQMASSLPDDQIKAGGINSLVRILNMADRNTEKIILERLQEADPYLAEEVKKHLFVFEDIIKLDDFSIQRVLREVDHKELALALKGANEEVRRLIFKNQSTRAAEMLKEEIELTGPVRLRDVQDAQQKIVKIIRTLEENGEVTISRGGEEMI